jgi:hypothetical protein
VSKVLKPSSTWAAFFATPLILALASGDALASINYNASKSNTGNYVLNPKDPNASSACTDAGGTVTRNSKGQNICLVLKATTKSP